MPIALHPTGLARVEHLGTYSGGIARLPDYSASCPFPHGTISPENRDDLLVYDQTNGPLAYMISRVTSPAPIGIFKRVSLPTYEAGVHGQIDEAKEQRGGADLMKLIHSGDTWEVSA